MASIQSTAGIFTSITLLYAIIKQFDSEKAVWPTQRSIEVFTFRDTLGREGFHLTADGPAGGYRALNISAAVKSSSHTFEIVTADGEGYDENKAPIGNCVLTCHAHLGQAVDCVLTHLMPERPHPVFTRERHPEMQDGEMFIGNFTVDEFEVSNWKTKRSGLVAYDIFGDRVKVDNVTIIPGFMQISEYEAKFGEGSAQQANRI